MKGSKDLDFSINLVLSGSSGVGKTSFIERFLQQDIQEQYNPTIGIDLKKITKQIQESNVEIRIYDTAGQEKLKAQSNLCFKKADGVIIMYDITDQNSFDAINFWYQQIENNVPKECKIILVGNKLDLNSKRQISKEKAIEWSEQKNFFFMEVSAKTNENDCVEEAFMNICDQIITDMNENKRQMKRKNTQDSLNWSKQSKAEKLQNLSISTDQPQEQKNCPCQFNFKLLQINGN